jgi:hypothetical protein
VELPIALVSDEDPGRAQPEATQDCLERDVQDGLDLVLAMDLGRHLGEDLQLTLPRLDVAFEGADTILIGHPQAVLVLIGHRGMVHVKRKERASGCVRVAPRRSVTYSRRR